MSLITSLLAAGKGGSSRVLDWTLQLGKLCVCRQAAGAGNLQALQAAWIANKHSWCRVSVPQMGIHPTNLPPKICAAAAYTGQLAMLQWLRQLGCPWNSATCSAAACSNQLQVISSNSPISFTVTGAHGFELLQVLRWARQQQPPCPWCSLPSLFTQLPIYVGRIEPQLHVMTDRMWMFLAHNNAPLPAAYAVIAEDAEKRLTTASLVLKAVLPAAVPAEVLEISLALSIE